MSCRDRGSMTVLWITLTAVIAVVAVATGGLGLAYAARAQAQVASDASALAAAVGTYPPAAEGTSPLGKARAAAAANGAQVVSCRCPVDPTIRARVVTVVTRVSVSTPIFGELNVHAVSSAEFDPRLWLGR